ncbi:LysM peptidoglycan-binding domain-containing protein [Paenibacillus oceani]|uniref:LysM peptidoglycan-binding domain-containing protein n=1 Tax=Paenibacillus oceani TaxID=2772510 RepID=A0A927C4E7_9BACL|nr:LysM peptidoglycan-binding domain-containing protein [Paenibacillus oceani]MBD2861090.1 LysM peptidoglycan-binding domain-containing protein [Paenibacillus oceani]
MMSSTTFHRTVLHQGSYKSIWANPDSDANKKKASSGTRLRMAAAALVMLACFGLGALFLEWPGNNEVQAAAIQIKEEVTVVPGDTLWSIAGQHVRQGEDIRDYIRKVKTANGMTSSTLIPGQVLQLPQ